MEKIEIYTKTGCPFCAKALALFKAKGVPQHKITEYNITDHPELRPEMVKRSKGVNTLPQIFIDNHHIPGADDMIALDKEGKLDALLK